MASVCLFLYLESNQVIIFLKVAKRNKKDQKSIFLLLLQTLLEFYQHLRTSFVIFSSYGFQMKQISILEIRGVTTSDETGNSTSWTYLYPKMDLGLEIQKTKVEIIISILEILCVLIFSQNGQPRLSQPRFVRKRFRF